MDVFEQVREVGTDEARIGDDRVAVAREVLRNEVRREKTRAGSRRRRRLGIGIGAGGVVAAGAAAAVVIGSVWAPVEPASAAEVVLEKAALATMEAEELVVPPGQYLRIETSSELLQFWDSRWADDDDSATMPFNSSRRDADAAILLTDQRALYVPADRGDTWYYDWGERVLTDSYGERAADAVAEWRTSPGGEQAANGRGGVDEMPGGMRPGRDGIGAVPFNALRNDYAEMPRDPEALRDWFRADGNVDEDEFHDWLVASFESPMDIALMPADLRATMFRMLALVPGVEVLARDDDSATLEYTRDAGGVITFVVDTARGVLASSSTTYGTGDIVGDVPSYAETVDVSVVDTAPEPTD